jgi:hypothetical protein
MSRFDLLCEENIHMQNRGTDQKSDVGLDASIMTLGYGEMEAIQLQCY